MNLDASQWVIALAETLAAGIELVGITVIFAGILLSLLMPGLAWLRSGSVEGFFDDFRHILGRSVLMGLEILVAADIIATVTIDLTISSLAALGMLILIRTFLSFSMEVELDGSWPWQRARRREARPADSPGPPQR